ncbi:MAG: ABC-type spermidine/putrescine transport system substrate-binding protein [Candidatus Phytoplasma cynodontis]|uniref:extracellular solute-binding protein n=1 Tax='Cynodon dactylon' phytoplasma TaxID=295320 RepID=UPI001265C30A|nr:extracellular solute-binding protein ['Cynodon dactylon' phytoplasma]KAB8121866.1 extracellular solute-binding protein ['Cynodon dactylon' phytoplasma]WIA07809.1 MAG: ABC-type spermidine/putrescine transport system substrate-binding protein [Candidatus Phytoplasma cynodontis]
MKRKMLFFTFFSLIIFYFIYSQYNKIFLNNKEVILFFNWGEYIDPIIIDEYNKQSSRFVIKQSFFSSNELAINKIKAGNKYDIAILSEYAIEQLKNDYLEIIENYKIKEDIQKTKKFEDLIHKYCSTTFQKQTFSIPYFWGKIGLLYNNKKIDKSEIVNWRNLFQNPNYKIALYNNSFEGVFIGIKAVNGDISGTNEDDIQKAKQWLLELKQKNSNLSFLTDQLLDYMRIKNEERYDITVAYSGDARFLMKQNDNLKYYDFSEEEESNLKGSNIWVDSFVLPKGSNKEGAYDFINFLLKKDNIQKNIFFTCYDSPYMDIWSKEISYLNLDINKNDLFYKYNETSKKKIHDVWNYIYSYPRPQDNYLFIFSLFILLFFLFLKINSYKKKNIYLI